MYFETKVLQWLYVNTYFIAETWKFFSHSVDIEIISTIFRGLISDLFFSHFQNVSKYIYYENVVYKHLLSADPSFLHFMYFSRILFSFSIYRPHFKKRWLLPYFFKSTIMKLFLNSQTHQSTFFNLLVHQYFWPYSFFTFLIEFLLIFQIPLKKTNI